MTEAKTVWELLDKVVREPIRDANNEDLVKQFEIVGGVPFVLDRFDQETYSSSSDTRSDVDINILRNIQRRKKNILKREGD